MKVKKLPYYIVKYDCIEISSYVMDALEEENIRRLSIIDGIPVIRRVLSEVCSYSVTESIMKRFMQHEVRRERLARDAMEDFLVMFGYACVGCRDNQPNQLAHTEPGGCLYSEENGF